MPGLSRLKVGVDVPWVTSWSAEEIVGVRPCPTVGGRLAAWQAERPGLGKPQYSMNHLQRQRLSVRHMLCPMCGAPTAAGDRWSQTGRFTCAGALRARDLGHLLPADLPDARRLLNAGSIAPLHLACARRAVGQCPHLRALDDTELKPFPDVWIVTPLMVEASPAPSAPNVLARPRQARVAVVSFLQICGVTETVDAAWPAAALP